MVRFLSGRDLRDLILGRQLSEGAITGCFAAALQTAPGFPLGHILGVTQVSLLEIVASFVGSELRHLLPRPALDLSKLLSTNQFVQMPFTDTEWFLDFYRLLALQIAVNGEGSLSSGCDSFDGGGCPSYAVASGKDPVTLVSQVSGSARILPRFCLRPVFFAEAGKVRALTDGRNDGVNR